MKNRILYATIGLPGCGKSTKAIKHIYEYGGVRANRDDIRYRLFGVYHGPEIDERAVTAEQDRIVADGFDNGYNVWIDDTNLSGVAKKHCRKLAERFDAHLVWVDMTDVPLSVCIKRDAARSRTVGEDVIRSMYDKYLANK